MYLQISVTSASHPSVFQKHITNSMFSLMVGIDSWPDLSASLHLRYYFWPCQPICSVTPSIKHCSHTVLQVFDGLLTLVHLKTTKIRSLHTTLLCCIQQVEWSYWHGYNNTSDYPRSKRQKSWPRVSTQLAALPTKQKCKHCRHFLTHPHTSTLNNQHY